MLVSFALTLSFILDTDSALLYLSVCILLLSKSDELQSCACTQFNGSSIVN